MLYEFITNRKFGISDICKKRYIWLINGKFMHPRIFKNSCIEAESYGYALDDNLVTSIRVMSLNPWLKEGKMSAIEKCESKVNAGVNPYMPSCNELEYLYDSASSGCMASDLVTAGLEDDYESGYTYNYDNYTSHHELRDFNVTKAFIWSEGVWSREEDYSLRETHAKFVSICKEVRSGLKTEDKYIVPFYRF